MELFIIAACGVIAVWAIGKTAWAVRTLREQRRNSDGWERGGNNGGSFGVGGIDPGGSDGGHGGGDCGGHGSSGGHGG